MICLDTTVLVDLWRAGRQPDSPVRACLARYPGEAFFVPATAAGEFCEGGAHISEQRLQDSLRFLERFEISPITRETGVQYARIVADLRRDNLLAGRSKFDLWNAASAIQHGARIVTRNPAHFSGIPQLPVIAY